MSESLPVVYLARHAETAWSLSGQHTGLTDLPLTDRGERNARQFGEQLRGRYFARVFTSPFRKNEPRLPAPDKVSRFEEAILPHLDAAYNLARWLMRNDADADDAVQDACLRALRFFGGFRGGDGRVWLLAIVRNTCYSKLKRNRVQKLETAFDEEAHGHDPDAPDPEGTLLKSLDAAALRRAVEALPEKFREVVVMRELEGLSYKQIVDVTEVPIGTVMSRLARARGRLQRSLKLEAPESGDMTVRTRAG